MLSAKQSEIRISVGNGASLFFTIQALKTFALITFLSLKTHFFSFFLLKKDLLANFYIDLTCEIHLMQFVFLLSRIPTVTLITFLKTWEIEKNNIK